MSVIRKDQQQLVFGAVVVGFLILLPFYAGEYTVTTFVRIIYFGFLASSVGMLISQAGMVSLTQTAFFGLAGYVIGLLGAERNMPFPWRDLTAIGAVLIMALIFGLIAMRTHKIVFLMITLAFGQICWAFAQQNRVYCMAGPAFAVSGRRRFSGSISITRRIFTGPRWLSLRSESLSSGFWRNPLLVSRLTGSRKPAADGGSGLSGLLDSSGNVPHCGRLCGGRRNPATYNTGIITPTTIQLSRTIWVLLMVILGGTTYFWGRWLERS